MGTSKKRNARVDVDGEMNEEQPPEITPDMTAREAMEAYYKFLHWKSPRDARPPMPNATIKGPGLRPNELFINTAYAMKSKKGKGQVSNMEQIILALRAKAAGGQAGAAAEMLMDMYFHSLKEGELQPVGLEIVWK